MILRRLVCHQSAVELGAACAPRRIVGKSTLVKADVVINSEHQIEIHIKEDVLCDSIA
jgi:hypothetical protein